MKKPKRPTLKEFNLTQADVETGNRFIRASEQLDGIDDDDKTWWRHSLFVSPAVVAWYVATADEFSIQEIGNGAVVGFFVSAVIGRIAGIGIQYPRLGGITDCFGMVDYSESKDIAFIRHMCAIHISISALSSGFLIFR